MTKVNEALKEVPLPFTPHKYQTEDAERGCLVHSFGLYQEMGLGKTAGATIIAVSKLLNGYNTVIVLCPAALVTQWTDWLVSLKELEVTAYRGTPTERKKLNLDVDFIVMSFQILQRDHEHIFENIKGPHYFVVDEATVLCNINNFTYKLLMGGMRTEKYFFPIPTHPKGGVDRKRRVEVKKRSDGMCLLTGTPINKPLDAYGLIKITNPEAYTNYNRFERYHVAKKDNFGNPTKYRNLEDLRSNLLENGSIREVTDHLDLPEKVFNVIKYELSPEHKKLYNRLVDERLMVLDDGTVVDATEAQALYHTCQRVIFSPEVLGYKKYSEGIEILRTIAADVDQAIIFGHYKATNGKVVEHFGAGGCYGDVPRNKQDQFVRDFQKGRLQFLAANAKSAGYGLNLQCSNQIVMAELPVTPRDFNQAVARSWRQGQKKRVVITVMVAKGTIQTTLLRRVTQKDDLMREVTHSKQSLRDDLMGE